jgi:subtilisin family serine protease
MVRFAPGIGVDEARAVTDSLGLREARGFDPRYGFGVYSLFSSESLRGVAASLVSQPDVIDAHHPLVDPEGFTRYFLPDELTVQFRDGISYPSMMAVVREGQSHVVRRQWTPGYFTIAVPEGSSVFEAIDAFNARDEVLFAEPSYFGYDDALGGTDPLFPQQWHLQNTGQQQAWTPGADMNVPGAWAVTQGDPGVVIAIIDTGVDLGHPDLVANILPRNGEDWNFASSTDDSPDDVGNHGTACSGIAAAAAENGLGVSGVAPGCRLLPLKVDLTSGANANRADAINYAVSRRPEFSALVMSMSWRMSSGDFTAVRLALENAWAQDCIILAASGNDNGAVSYPARYPEVIAVGATSPCDQRKSPTSCDGETFWGSNFGPELEIVAPGVKIVTTDRVGAAGYDGSDYTFAFNGTSSATPGAAGVAALICSANPSLTNQQVRTFLQISARDEVGEPVEDTPGFDVYMGYGRVDALQAVLLASGMPFVRAEALRLKDRRFGNDNGGLDPGEYGTIDLELASLGTATATDVTASISSDRPDILAFFHSRSEVGDVAGGASPVARRAFSFILDPSAPCGDTVKITVRVEHTLGSSESSFCLPLGSLALSFRDDGESGPGNFVTESPTGNGDWTLLPFAAAHSPTMSWFSTDAPVIKDDVLALGERVLGSAETLSFWHLYDTESTFDGGVIEISTDGGSSWNDLGPFITRGGYNSVLSGSFGNPLGGRMAWSGVSGVTMSEVLVDLSSFGGQSVSIRWRLGCDSSVAALGWSVDDVSFLSPDCEVRTSIVHVAVTAAPLVVSSGDELVLGIDLTSTSPQPTTVRLKLTFLLPDQVTHRGALRTVQAVVPALGTVHEEFRLQMADPLPNALVGEVLALVRVVDVATGDLLSVDAVRFTGMP